MKPWEEYRQQQGVALKPWEEYQNHAMQPATNNTAEDVLGAVTKFDNGYTFGFGRKLGGLLNAVGSWPVDRVVQLLGSPNTPSFTDRYNEITDTAGNAAQRFSSKNPLSAIGLELGGALLNPINKAGARYMGNAGTFGDKLLRSGTVGAGTSALYSAGQADDIQDFKDNAVKDALIGTGINMAFPVAGKAAQGIGYMGRKGLGWLTGTGEAINQAFNAGKRGSQKFLDSIRNETPLSEVVEDAKTALNNLKRAKNARYAKNMEEIGRNVESADIQPIRQNFNDVRNSFNYKGFDKADNATRNALERIDDVISDFEKTPSAHDVLGLDALKQRVQDISFPAEQRSANRIVGQVANNIKSEINKQSPEYAKIMQDYASASDEINELSKSLLGSGRRPNTATALGKLQRAYRNNAQSSYARGQSLIDKLDDEAQAVKDALAGQALNSYLPRGGLGGSLGGLAGVAAVAHNPYALLTMPFFSPRLMGNAAYYAGRGTTYLKPLSGQLNPAALSSQFYEND